MPLTPHMQAWAEASNRLTVHLNLTTSAINHSQAVQYSRSKQLMENMKQGGQSVCMTCLHASKNHTAPGKSEDKKSSVIVGCDRASLSAGPHKI